MDHLAPSEDFTFVAHSFGVGLALEMAGVLEKEGRTGTLILLDASVSSMKRICEDFMVEDESEFQNGILLAIMSVFGTEEKVFPILVSV